MRAALAVVLACVTVVATLAAPHPAAAQVVAFDANADVHAFGAPFLGDTSGIEPAARLIGIAPTSDGDGYWLGASDGGVFDFGSARKWV